MCLHDCTDISEPLDCNMQSFMTVLVSPAPSLQLNVAFLPHFVAVFKPCKADRFDEADTVRGAQHTEKLNSCFPCLDAG